MKKVGMGERERVGGWVSGGSGGRQPRNHLAFQNQYRTAYLVTLS